MITVRAWKWSTGSSRPAAERPGLVERPQIPATDVPGRAAHGVLPGCELRALPDRAGQPAGGLSVSRRLLLTSGPMPGTGRRWGLNVALPWGFTVGISGDFRWTNYEGQWAPFVPDNCFPRRPGPDPASYVAEPRDCTVYGFSPSDRVFQPRCAESNAQLFDFKRNLVEMRWVRQF